MNVARQDIFVVGGGGALAVGGGEHDADSFAHIPDLAMCHIHPKVGDIRGVFDRAGI